MRKLLILLMAAGVLATPALPETYSLGPVVIGSGGFTQTGGPYTLFTTAGEGLVGFSATSGTPLVASYGFWTPERTLVGVEQRPAEAPASFALRAPAPNPFSTRATICYDIARGAAVPVRLLVYDVRGARVRTLVNSAVSPGRYTSTWDGRGDNGQIASGGIFFLRLEAGHFTQTRKIILLP